MTMTRKSGLLLGSALGTAVALGIAAPASAGDLAPAKVTTDGAWSVIAVHAEETGGQFVPKDGEPTDDFPEDEAPQAGDAFTFTEALTQDGVLVGTDKGTCRIVSFGVFQCEVVATFANGSFTVRFGGAEDEEAPEVEVYKIAAGTGAFADVRGTVSVKNNDDETSEITVRYATGGGQVTHVPVGGAETGGSAGSAGGSGAAAGMLGATAVVAGAGLLGSPISS